MMLFTLSACPMGRSMGTVLSEIQNRYPQIKIETIYVEIMTDITNYYRIKKNPTTLFLDQEANELYRMEGFVETGEMVEMIEKLHHNVLQLTEKFESNQETIETYTIYLYKNKEIMPLEIHYHNKTSVKAPRITVISLLLDAQINGYENPFPLSSKLGYVNFDQHHGDAMIYVDADQVDPATRNKMKCALTKTLSHFGIKDVEITISNHGHQ
ncbi:hypothetical protein GCM10010911_47450 [Paenibacillus nasutitermitis]|uniref:Uncharacterized protein n=2 Tax=Paenibacillus nasutitermitis TaxID=1652958 RepID=A0A917DZ37_9BACL|nr:hypothetical protein GCM10010911_47450 [Paenibacillus nasutitermitis]